MYKAIITAQKNIYNITRNNYLKSEPPFESIPTISGKSFTNSLFTDSQPKSSKAITSQLYTAPA